MSEEESEHTDSSDEEVHIGGKVYSEREIREEIKRIKTCIKYYPSRFIDEIANDKDVFDRIKNSRKKKKKNNNNKKNTSGKEEEDDPMVVKTSKEVEKEVYKIKEEETFEFEIRKTFNKHFKEYTKEKDYNILFERIISKRDFAFNEEIDEDIQNGLEQLHDSTDNKDRAINMGKFLSQINASIDISIPLLEFICGYFFKTYKDSLEGNTQLRSKKFNETFDELAKEQENKKFNYFAYSKRNKCIETFTKMRQYPIGCMLLGDINVQKLKDFKKKTFESGFIEHIKGDDEKRAVVYDIGIIKEEEKKKRDDFLEKFIQYMLQNIVPNLPIFHLKVNISYCLVSYF